MTSKRVRNIRVLGAKGNLTVPVNLRRDLGLVGGVPVEFKSVGDSLFVLQARKHCIVCGSTGVTLSPVHGVHVCKNCLDVATSAKPIKEELCLEDAIDNYCTNLNKMLELKRENVVYETFIQTAGLDRLDNTCKTAKLAGNDSNVSMQLASTVKDPTEEAYTFLKSFMHPMLAGNFITRDESVKISASSELKEVAVILTTDNYARVKFVAMAGEYCIDEDTATKLLKSWKGNFDKDSVLIKKVAELDSETLNKCTNDLELAYNYEKICKIFPTNSKKVLAAIAECFIVTTAVKISADK